MKVYKVSEIYGDGDGKAALKLIGIWKNLDKAIEDNKDYVKNLVEKIYKKRKNDPVFSGWMPLNYTEEEKREELIKDILCPIDEAKKENNYIIIPTEEKIRNYSVPYSSVGGILIEEIEVKK